MNPSSRDILNLIMLNKLGDALTGTSCVFETPSHINGYMLPTDHNELLFYGIYPLVSELGQELVEHNLDMAIKSICVDALGIFCAHQIFYTQIINEHEMKSPIKIDRFELPRFLAKSFAAYSNELHRLEIVKGDLDSDRPYKITISGMKILERDYAIDWGGIYEF